jgi:hypothetical protein
VVQEGSARDGSAATNPGSNAAGSDVPGSNAGSDHAATNPGSDHAGSNVESDHGSDVGSNTPPPAEVVQVPLFAKNGVAFEVFENGTKVLDGPDNLEVPKGEKRTVVIKARGYKDKTIVVEGTKKKVQISLDRLPRTPVTPVNPDQGSGHATPPALNCTSTILDPKNKACVSQYCAMHPKDDNCDFLQ